jgi:hypothetical protein
MHNLFNLKGLNIWLLASGILLNFLWASALMTIAAVIAGAGQPPEWLALLEIAGAFLGSLVIGLVTSRLAHDNRGPSYGLIGSLGAALLIALVVFQANLEIGFIMCAVAILGGLNGGMLSQRRSD